MAWLLLHSCKATTLLNPTVRYRNHKLTKSFQVNKVLKLKSMTKNLLKRRKNLLSHSFNVVMEFVINFLSGTSLCTFVISISFKNSTIKWFFSDFSGFAGEQDCIGMRVIFLSLKLLPILYFLLSLSCNSILLFHSTFTFYLTCGSFPTSPCYCNTIICLHTLIGKVCYQRGSFKHLYNYIFALGYASSSHCN